MCLTCLISCESHKWLKMYVLVNFTHHRMNEYESINHWYLILLDDFTLSRPGGASEARMTKFRAVIQKPLALRCLNFVTFSFIFKTCSDQILAKLVNQRLLLLFSHRDIPKILKVKNFPLLENCWNWHGGQFWVRKNDSGHKNSFFQS